MGRLEGKVAIVTGAAAGLGEGIAKHYVREGARVLVCDVDARAGEALASTSESMAFCRADVTRAEDWRGAVGRAVELWGRVDVLVNNAGTSYVNKSTNEVTEAEFDKVMAVNVKSVFLGSNAFTEQVRKQGGKEGGGGVMINIASVGAHRPRPGLVWYNASKGAVANATRGLAAEYGPEGIRVNSICPLATATALLPAFVGGELTPEVERALGDVPLGRMGRVDDVAGAAVFLASAEASFITGVNLDVDGGRAI
ncbi:hypothetical protein N3K66_008994 [Trichothecium roseum]|uniref:Uncharacterized protein n=1 Tax=Trichothecium roseum TaxID=47278 RepID=A0ACC0URE0_9HYPO|nr:hypothetical protein N3K66_008994 [Trichothecium roseum]